MTLVGSCLFPSPLEPIDEALFDDLGDVAVAARHTR
jgi:hypothetical protein